MYLLKYSSRFKKDLKRFARNKTVLCELAAVLDILAQKKKLPAKNHNHRLSGEFNSCYECHLRFDVLLVYRIEESEITILLLHIGSHSELF